MLGLLVERGAHPYAVAQRFNARVGAAWGLSRSQVYPVVRDLERRGFVERVEPAAGGSGTPLRGTVFQATPRGREVFEAWLGSDAADDPGPVRNALFVRLGFLQPEHVSALLEVVDQREHALLSRIREYSETCPGAGVPEAEMDWEALGFALILDGTLAMLQGELRWLRRLRETLEAKSRSRETSDG